MARLAKKTIKDYTRVVNKVLIPALGSRMVADSGQKDALEIHQSLAAHPRSANFALSVLSSSLSSAEEWKQRPRNSNPCLDVVGLRGRAHPRTHRSGGRCLCGMAGSE